MESTALAVVLAQDFSERNQKHFAEANLDELKQSLKSTLFGCLDEALMLDEYLLHPHFTTLYIFVKLG